MSMEITLTSQITVRLVQQAGGDHMIVAAAKVSTSGEEAAKFAVPCPIHPPDHPDFDNCVENEGVKANYGLIRYLMQHRHGSVFEHGLMTFFVHAPIFVWREWHRHRIGFAYSDYGMDEGLGQSFNEESGRYKQLDPVFYVPTRNRPMMKVDGWKPGRPKFERCESETVFKDLYYGLRRSYELAYRTYEDNLSMGIDPGLARDCLPVGIYSSCWVTTNPRALMHFLSLRTHEPEAKAVSYPLHEIEVAARQCEELFKVGWPLTHRAFCECGRVAP